MLERVRARRERWDIVVVGGGATGAGVAVDAASRGYSVALLEQSDFGKGTSSRSTKLVHGGVRYLARGNISLVMEALEERDLLRTNAPHLVSDLPLVVPAYAWWERPYYGAGLKAYDLLAGLSPFRRSKLLSRSATLQRIPTIRAEGLRGGVEYHDGQFDDARLLINLIQTAVAHGATAVNYARVEGISTGADGRIDGVVARDLESGVPLSLSARVVVNATGAFVDGIRRMTRPDAEPIIAPSQGIHLVFDGSFLPGGTAILVPRTPDGRVLFAIPWLGHTLIGTTDTPVAEALLEPTPLDEEIDFVLATAGHYLRTPPGRSDVLSAFAGIRPLLRGDNTKTTAALSRDHTLRVNRAGLITTTGGKWTTYRNMAQETVDLAASTGGLPRRRCVTKTLRIAGADDGENVQRLMRDTTSLAEPLHDALPWTAAHVVWAARHEMARTVEDVLARRCRALFLNARAAVAMAPRAAALLAQELGRDEAWQRREVESFAALARNYMVAD
jgi:glycerol-3-phosphate dehydrogenase